MIAKDKLRSIVERIEHLQEEKKAISDDIKDIYAEAKSNGFDTPVIRQIVKDRGKDKSELQEFEAVYQLYASALGMLPDFEVDTESNSDNRARPHLREVS